MVSDLGGKIAVVTGSSRGIGRAIALKAGAMGATVCVHYNSSAAAATKVVKAIEASGGKAFAVSADLSQRNGPYQLFEKVDAELKERFGSTAIDILINNAGAGTRATIEDVTEDDFDEVIQLDLKAPFFITKLALERMRDGGRIINVSSMGTRVAYPAMASYAPAKAGLEALTLLLAAHLGPRQITVNAVLPGATATDFHPGAQDPEISKQLAQSIALGRVGQPEDIADVVVFLASDQGRWVTAQCIDTSGGQMI